MNHETVSELYEIAQEWSYEKYSKKETGYTREYWAAYKLAELIVKECAELCDRFQARDVGMQPAECAGAIRHMFEIK